MPAYSKTNWVDGSVPAIDATNLNKIEQGIFDSLRQDGSTTMSGQLVTTAGSAATPAIAPTGDANTGIFFPAADTLSLGTAGAERLRIESSGFVGLGLTASYRLDVASYGATPLRVQRSGEYGEVIKIGRNGVSDGAGIGYPADNVFSVITNANERLRITSAGNVGIGTNSPTALVSMHGAPQATSGAILTLRDTTATGGNITYGAISFFSSAGTDFSIGKASEVANSALAFRNANTGAEFMRITSAGNLLIGTTTDYTATEKAGAVTIDGYASRNVVINSGTTNSQSNTSLIIQNATPFSGNNGAVTANTFGIYSAPIISNDGSGGANSVGGNGIVSSPVLLSSSSSARIGLTCYTGNSIRNSVNDLSTNASNFLAGTQNSAGHGASLPNTAVSGTVLAIQGTTANNSGTITTSSAALFRNNCGNTSVSQVNTSTTVNGVNAELLLGHATAGASSITDYYAFRSTSTINASGTLTNFYGLHIGTPTVTGTLTNKWAIYTTDANMRSSHAGYFLIGYTASNGAYPLQVNGQIFATSSTIATSDRRYKKDVVALDGALDIVKALNPVQFSWKEHSVHKFNTDVPTVGFIAQEVQEVLKDKPYLTSLVKKSECTWETETGEFVDVVNQVEFDGELVDEITQKPVKETHTEEFLGIAESNLIAILTQAVKELAAEVEALKAQLAK